MSIEVRVPQLPESVTDATLVAWHKKPGEAVGRDENLVDLETDKVVLEVPAPAAGVIKEIKVENGATVTSGQVLAILEAGEGAAAAQAAASAAHSAGRRREPKAAAAAAASSRRPRSAWSKSTSSTPAQIAGSGRDGRISKGDVIQHMAGKEAAPAKPAAKPAPAVQAAGADRRAHRTARADDASACAHRRASRSRRSRPRRC